MSNLSEQEPTTKMPPIPRYSLIVIGVGAGLLISAYLLFFWTQNLFPLPIMLDVTGMGSVLIGSRIAKREQAAVRQWWEEGMTRLKEMDGALRAAMETSRKETSDE